MMVRTQSRLGCWMGFCGGVLLRCLGMCLQLYEKETGSNGFACNISVFLAPPLRRQMVRPVSAYAAYPHLYLIAN